MTNLKLQNKSKILKSNYSDSLSLTLDAIEVGLRSVNPKRIIENSVETSRNYLTITDYSGKKIDLDLGSVRSYLLSWSREGNSINGRRIHKNIEQ